MANNRLLATRFRNIAIGRKKVGIGRDDVQHATA